MQYPLEFYSDHNSLLLILKYSKGALDIPEVPVKIFTKVPVTSYVKFILAMIENKMVRGTGEGINKVSFAAFNFLS